MSPDLSKSAFLLKSFVILLKPTRIERLRPNLFRRKHILRALIAVLISLFSLKKKSEAFDITMLSVCPLLVSFEPNGRFSWNSAVRSCYLRYPWRHIVQSRSFNHSKMADVQTSEVDVKFSPVSVGPWRVMAGNHGNQTILVWQFNPYHSKTHCLTTVTMQLWKSRYVVYRTNVTVLLNYVRKVGELVLSWTSCFISLYTMLLMLIYKHQRTSSDSLILLLDDHKPFL
jgi:hypothetical protein